MLKLCTIKSCNQSVRSSPFLHLGSLLSFKINSAGVDLQTPWNSIILHVFVAGHELQRNALMNTLNADDFSIWQVK